MNTMENIGRGKLGWTTTSGLLQESWNKVWRLLQEHPLLAWPLFIFLLALAFYLYLEDYARIHMQYLFWLTVLSPYLYWLYSL
jgi:hypothetical protein